MNLCIFTSSIEQLESPFSLSSTSLISIITLSANTWIKKFICLAIVILSLGSISIGQVTPDSVTIGDSLQTVFSPDSTINDSIMGMGGMGDSAFLGGGFPGDSAKAPVSAQQKYIDSLKASSDLQASVVYKAKDSIVYDVKNGTLFMYESANLTYDDIQLDAKEVWIEIDKQTLHARGVDDSLGNYIGRPAFTQDGQTYNAKGLSYNFKSQKGRISEGKMVEGEGYVLAEVAKYHDDGSFHGKDGKYTTCDAEDPHYYIQSRKLKILPNKQLISGPLNLVIAGFPIPIVVPFGFVPNRAEGQRDGVILPRYGEAQDRGFYLQNIGYYMGINEFLDLQLDGDIYTRGGWRFAVATKYNVKYKFTGNLRFQYGVQRFNEKTDPDFQRTTAWNLTWSHNQPIDPTARISGSVNISSSNRFNRDISFNQADYVTNNLNSSINFQKNFNNLPFSLNMSVRHQQDLNKETMTLQLPEMTFNVNRQTPFKNIKSKNLKFLSQIGVNYNMRAKNTLNQIPDSLFIPILFSPKDSVDHLEIVGGDSSLIRRTGGSFYSNGLQHTASTSTTIKLFNYINISPSFNYNEFWYLSTVRKDWDAEQMKVVETDVPGFQRGYNFTTSISASTNFYGIYQLKNSKREYAFRQRFSPSVSYSLKPDFADPRFGFYDSVQVDTFGKMTAYSIFENGIYGGPTARESQSINFSLSSVIEMKYRKKESFDPEFDEKEDKYVRSNLIDNIGASMSYNFAADSFNLSTMSLRFRTSLFDKKVNINASGTLDPYVYGYNTVPFPLDPGSPRRQNRFLISETGQLGRITRAQVSLSTSFRSKRREGAKNKSEDFDEIEFQEIQNTLYQYVDFDIPWTLRFRYNLSYSKPGFDTPSITQTVNFDGDVNFTPKWKIGFNSGYDIANFKFTQTSLNIFRDLHCWEMSFRWIPFGSQKSYSLTINVRSATLKDLRLTKNDFWQDRFRTL